MLISFANQPLLIHIAAKRAIIPSLFELFLGAQLTGVSALFLSAVGRTGRETSVAFSANGLFAVESLGQESEGRIVDTSAQTQHQVKRGFLLDVVIAESASVLELLARENKSLLIRRNAFFILDLGFDIVDRVAGLHVERDGFTRQGLYENLHGGTSKRIATGETLDRSCDVCC